jgi:hypothetical protein
MSARADYLRCVALAAEAYADEIQGRKHSEAYLEDQGPRWPNPGTRYVAGVLTTLGGIGMLRCAVHAGSWAELADEIRRRPVRERYSDATAWRVAAFDALAAGAEPHQVAAACAQLDAWIQEAAL